ncbi:hypothetical protein BB560_006904 [Smittium megazygosporum]|uniref:EXS domain-containing protein n=1 Tax=Smittium megazygosporum TaxID=133381 RepID=A0A2T9Y0A7_9FUNG|nr:hypothetical protein BB560_006904 [Smittium megazygosporum]
MDDLFINPKYTELIMLSILPILVCLPVNALFRSLRISLLRSLFRSINPISFQKTHISDIIFADVLTSCSRAFADLAVILCSISSSLFVVESSAKMNDFSSILNIKSKKSTYFGKDLCSSPLLGPIVTSIPFLIRLRQCIYDYLLSSSSHEKGRHLANCLKYFSALPVIFLSSFQQEYMKNQYVDSNSSQKDWFFNVLFYTWLFSAIFNSGFSLYWDVVFDWNLGNLKSFSLSNIVYSIFSHEHLDNSHLSVYKEEQDFPDSIIDPESLSPDIVSIQYSPNNLYNGPTLLRENLLFINKYFYYTAILVDTILRAAWTIKLSPHLKINSLPYIGFILGILEVFRRFFWVIFRVEKEHAC